MFGLLVGSAGACSGGSGSHMSNPKNDGGGAGVREDEGGAAGAEIGPLTNFQMACTGVGDCMGMQFCTTEAMCGACLCTQPVQVACMSDFGCAGEKRCLSEASCDPCVCASVGNAWIVNGQGTAREVEAAPTGGAVVRLDGAPWFVAYDRLGIDTPLATTVAFDWVSSFVVAADASLYVAGLRNKLITVSHVSPSGALLSSLAWPADFYEFGAILSGPNGQLYLSARLQPTQANPDYDVLVAVNADGTPGTQINLDIRDVATRVAINATGDILEGTPAGVGIADYAPAEAWFTPVLRGNARSLSTTANDSLGGYIAGIAPVGNDGWVFAAVKRTHLELENQSETWSATLHRVAATGAKVWDLPDLDASGQLPFALLSDSIYVGSDRVSLSGGLISKVGPPTSPRSIGSATVGPLAAVVVRSTGDQTYSVERIDFPALAPTKHSIGDACATTTDCPKGSGCCDNVCANSAKCANGSPCSSAIACVDTCYSAADAPGFCAASCVATKDCDTGNFCTSGLCLPSCGNAGCLHGASCKSEPDAEGISVKVCVY